MPSELSELERLLPYTIRDRWWYYRDFVRDRSFEIAKLDDMEEQRKSAERYIDLIFLLRMLYGYFVIGYQNYDATLSYFESRQVDGFQIGTTEFSGRSQITLDWQELVNSLKTLVRELGIGQYVEPSLSTDEVIRRILGSQSMGRRDGHRR